jgi:hypothetical protein
LGVVVVVKEPADLEPADLEPADLEIAEENAAVGDRRLRNSWHG